MNPFLAEWYPEGLAPAVEAVAWHPAAGFACDRRPLSVGNAAEIAGALRGRAAQNRRLASGAVIPTLHRVHAAWAEVGSPLRAGAVTALHALTGFPQPVLDLSLRELFQGMTGPHLASWLEAAGIRDEWLDRPGIVGAGVHVFGPALTVLVASGNIPGAALPSLIHALLLKSPCLVKTSSSEPVLFPLYARSLAAACPELAEGVVVTGWEGGRDGLERVVLEQAEAVIAYGGDASLQALRRLLPLKTRFLPYGHRISFSAVGRELLVPGTAAEAAEAAAIDLCLFDQQGCLSPQAIYVERGGAVTPEAFAELLAASLERLASAWPRRALQADEAAPIHQYRASIEMRSLAEPEVRLWRSAVGTRWTVALVPEKDLEPCCLNRTAVVRPVEELAELPVYLRALQGSLATAALGMGEPRRSALAALLAEFGVTRITSLGRAQRADSSLYHDGVNALATLARFVRVESGALPGE